jgi:putative CocE/NonD family hydrolase
MGPWTHGTQRDPVGELTFGFGASIAFVDLRADFQTMQLRWFDHWLRDTDTGILDEPPVKVFQMGANRWLELPDWPPPATARELHLRAEGGLSDARPDAGEAPDAFDYDPDDPVPTRGGALLMAPGFPVGPVNQAPTEARADVLCYTTEPLTNDLPVAGRVSVVLWAASSAPDTDFVARLCDVHPDGRSLNLTDGVIRARHRCMRTGEPPTPIEPGRPYEYEIDLWSTCHVFKAGHRVRLQVTSSNFPRWDRNLNTGEPPATATRMQVARQTVFHDRDRPSRLVLPIAT